MNIDGYIPRIVDDRIQAYLRTFGAICVEGPKWCGKTWSSERAAKSEYKVGDPAGNFQNRRLAEIDIQIPFQGETPHLIDEWQEVPALWDAARSNVDSGTGKGCWILTGSSTPNRKGVLHTGTGRIGTIRMGTMSLWEMGASGGEVSFEELCRDAFSGVRPGKPITLRGIAERILRGGWPGALGMDFKDAINIPREYVELIAQNDIQRVSGIHHDAHKVQLLLRSLARNETTAVSTATLCRDISEVDGARVDPDTVSGYLNALERMFVTCNQRPFDASCRSSVRVKQMEKRHFCDPSLACALLKLTPEKLIGDLNTFGFMFEAMVERDLRAYCLGLQAELYHYQDYANREIDSVVEFPDGDWAAIEIKLGTNQEDAAAKSLLAFRNTIAAEGKRAPKALIVIIGMATSAYRRPDGVQVCPPHMLRPFAT